MVGGTTSGYSEIGSPRKAITPARNIKSDSTPAKIGRSMKNLERFMALRGRCRVTLGCGLDIALQLGLGGHAHGLRLQERTRPHTLQAVDDDALAGLQAFGHHPQAVHWRTEPDFPV